jgi:hypothetical protein
MVGAVVAELEDDELPGGREMGEGVLRGDLEGVAGDHISGDAALDAGDSRGLKKLGVVVPPEVDGALVVERKVLPAIRLSAACSMLMPPRSRP